MKVWEPSFDFGMLSRGFQLHDDLMPGHTVSHVLLARARMADLERGVWASMQSSIIRPFCKMAEQAIFLEERVDCTAFMSSLSTNLNRGALIKPLLPQRVSEVAMFAPLTNHESEGRSISFFGRIWPLYRGV